MWRKCHVISVEEDGLIWIGWFVGFFPFYSENWQISTKWEISQSWKFTTEKSSFEKDCSPLTYNLILEGRMGEVRCKTCTNSQHEAPDVCVHKKRETLTNKKENIVATVDRIYKIMRNWHVPFLHGTKEPILSMLDAYVQFILLAADKNTVLRSLKKLHGNAAGVIHWITDVCLAERKYRLFQTTVSILFAFIMFHSRSSPVRYSFHPPLNIWKKMTKTNEKHTMFRKHCKALREV